MRERTVYRWTPEQAGLDPDTLAPGEPAYVTAGGKTRIVIVECEQGSPCLYLDAPPDGHSGPSEPENPWRIDLLRGPRGGTVYERAPVTWWCPECGDPYRGICVTTDRGHAPPPIGWDPVRLGTVWVYVCSPECVDAAKARLGE